MKEPSGPSPKALDDAPGRLFFYHFVYFLTFLSPLEHSTLYSFYIMLTHESPLHAGEGCCIYFHTRDNGLCCEGAHVVSLILQMANRKTRLGGKE